MSDGFLSRLRLAENRDRLLKEKQIQMCKNDSTKKNEKNKYIIMGPIARGGFSEVMRAKRSEDGLYVAIKVFRRTEEAYQLYLRETDALQRIFSGQLCEQIITYISSEIHDRKPRIILELGKMSLRKRIENARSNNLLESADFINQIIKAVRFIHSISIAHRDLKPENFVICENDRVKMCDFGFAKVCEDRLQTICGTPAYMAPELYKRSKHGYIGLPVDVWSLGAIVYEVLHKRFAFCANNMRELKMRITHAKHNSINFSLPKVFRILISSCFIIDVDKRPTIFDLKIPVKKRNKPN